MRGGVIIIVVGLFLAYLGLSGHYKPFVRAFKEVAGLEPGAEAGSSGDLTMNAGRPGAAQVITYADLLRPLDVPGVLQEPYAIAVG